MKANIVHTNRKRMPADLRASQGKTDYHSTAMRMLCLQRVVKMLSSSHSSESVTLPQNHQRSKPKVIVCYIINMKGADLI